MANTPPHDPSSRDHDPSASSEAGQPPSSTPPGQDSSSGQPPATVGQPPANWAPTPNPVQGGFSAPTGAHYPKQSQAVLALVLSILSFVVCCLTAIPGAYIGWQEVQAIDRGEVDPAKRGMALAAVVFGLINLALTILAILGFFFFIVMVSAPTP